MKGLFFAFSLILFLSFDKGPTNISTKNLIGVWQEKDSIVGSGLRAFYVFLPNNSFYYFTNGYDNLNPLVNISGTFAIKNESINFKIKKYKIRTDFNIISTEPAWKFGEFAIDKGGLKEVINKDTSEIVHSIKSCNLKSKNRKCIVINNVKFFRVYDDPNKFFIDNKIDK